MENKNKSCPECGAPRVEGMDCWAQLGAIIAWEWQDPALMAQHYLTVTCCNVQHPAQFNDHALATMKRLFLEHLAGEVSLAEIRRRNSQLFEGSVKVLKPEGERQPILRRWPMTIADVYIPDQAEGAAQRVKLWAASIYREI
ncbi:MAG: DUF5946 family protein [Candidatus Promineifilaceae bacterium]|nr:DUF5946 family protein [Candidatus Promineifilaceae bacterium]